MKKIEFVLLIMLVAAGLAFGGKDTTARADGVVELPTSSVIRAAKWCNVRISPIPGGSWSIELTVTPSGKLFAKEGKLKTKSPSLQKNVTVLAKPAHASSATGQSDFDFEVAKYKAKWVSGDGLVKKVKLECKVEHTLPATATVTTVVTVTQIASATATNTATYMPTETATYTPTPTATYTATSTASPVPATATSSPTASPTVEYSFYWESEVDHGDHSLYFFMFPKYTYWFEVRLCMPAQTGWLGEWSIASPLATAFTIAFGASVPTAFVYDVLLPNGAEVLSQAYPVGANVDTSTCGQKPDWEPTPSVPSAALQLSVVQAH